MPTTLESLDLEQRLSRPKQPLFDPTQVVGSEPVEDTTVSALRAQPIPDLKGYIDPADLEQGPPAPPPEPPKPGDEVDLTPEQLAEYRKQTGELDPLLDFTPEQLAQIEINDPEGGNLRRMYMDRPDLIGDPDTIKKLAQANKLVHARHEIPTAGLPPEVALGARVVGLGETAIEAAKHMHPLKAAKDFAVGVAKYAKNAIQGIASPFVPEETQQEYRQKAAENLAASELAVTGLAGGVRTAAHKAAQVAGIAKPYSELTDHEATDLFFSDLTKEAERQRIVTGKGAITQQIAGPVIEELAQAGKPIRPEEVSQLAAGDPFTFYAFAKGFGAAGSLVPAEAKAVLNDAATWVGEVSAESAGTALEGIGAAAKNLAKPIEVVSRQPSRFFKTGISGGLSKIAKEVGKRVPGAAEGVEQIGKEIRLGERAPLENYGGIVSDSAQFVRDAIEATPGAAGHVAAGGLFDVSTAAVMSEFPEEERGTGIGLAFGLLGAGRGLAGRVISGQEIAPRNWGTKTQIPTSGPFKGSAFDQQHEGAYRGAAPAVKQRINAVREFLRTAAPGVDLFYVPDKATFKQSLIDQGVSEADAELWSSSQGLSLRDLNGKPVAFAANIDAAPHESFHPFQDVIGKQANDALNQKVLSAYTEAEINQRGATDAKNLGWDGKGDYRDFLLDVTGEGYAQAIDSLTQEAARIIEFSTGQKATPADAKAQAMQMFNDAMTEATSKNPGVSPEAIRRNVWRGLLTEEQQKAAANNYIANEISADTWSAVFKHGKDPKGLVRRFAKVASTFVQLLGGEPLEGRFEDYTPLRKKAVEAVREAARARTEQPPKLFGEEPTVTPKIPEAPVAPRAPSPSPVSPPGTPEEEAKITKDVAATAPETPTGPEVNAQSQRDILGTMAEAKAGNYGVKITRRAAPGTPAGAIEVSRGRRREQIETARGIPDDQKPLWEKNFTPVKTVKLNDGSIQEQGWSPEVLAANAEKVAKFLAVADPALSPFEIDRTKGTFTPEGWKQLFDKVNVFAGNQAAGLTGKGTPLAIGKARAFGFFEPTGNRVPVGSLTDAEMNFINYLFGYPLPGEGKPTVARGGSKQYGVQLISEATEPGRALPLVEPRTFASKEAERLGFAGKQVLEVNPLRAEIEATARATGNTAPSLIEAWQNLNLRDIVRADVAPELPAVRPVGVTLRAGFKPRDLVTPKIEKELLESKVRFEDGTLKPVFHGTVSSFDLKDFDTSGFRAHFGAPGPAAARTIGPLSSRTTGAVQSTEGSQTIPVFLDIRNPLKLDDAANWNNALDVVRALEKETSGKLKLPRKLRDRQVGNRLNDLSDKLFREKQESGVREEDIGEASYLEANKIVIDEIKQLLKDQGYDGIEYENAFEVGPRVAPDYSRVGEEFEKDYGDTSYIPFSNDQIKSAVSFKPAERKEIEITGPDGKRYKAMFDGYQDFSVTGRGLQPQITALENIPGVTTAKSTTYGVTLEKAGFTLPELPSPEVAFKPPRRTEDFGTIEKQFALEHPNNAGSRFVDEFSKIHQKDEELRRLMKDVYFKTPEESDDLYDQAKDVQKSLTKPSNVAEAKLGGYIQDRYPELVKESKLANDYFEQLLTTKEQDIPRMPLIVQAKEGFAIGKIVQEGHDAHEAQRFLDDWRDEGYAEVKSENPALARWIDDNLFSGSGKNAATEGVAFKPKSKPNAADEDFDAVHYSSNAGLRTVDPSFFGKGKATPADLRGGPKSYFFVKGSDFGQDAAIFKDAGLHEHEVRIKGSDLYDLRTGKPDDLGWRKTVNREEADDLVKEAGYKGIVLDTADGRQVIAMFEPVKVKKPAPVQFSPMPANPRAIKQAAVRDEKTGEVHVGMLHPSIVNDLIQKSVAEGKYHEGITDNLVDGFVTNDGEFLTRDEAFDRAIELDQVSEKDFKLRNSWLESRAFAAERKFKPKQIEPPTQAEFDDPDTIKDALAKPGWAILTGTREKIDGKEVPFDHPENLKANEELKADMDAQGLDYFPVDGTYKGQPQGESFVVLGITPKNAQKLAKNYGQESVSVPEGLLYGNGTIVPGDVSKTIVGPEAKKQEFFSTTPEGVSFSIPYEFGKPIEPVGNQPELFGKSVSETEDINRRLRARVNNKKEKFPESAPLGYVKDDVGNFKLDKKTGKPIPEKQDYSFLDSGLAKEAGKGLRGDDREAAYVESAGDKLAAEYRKAVKDPKVAAGAKWYSTLRTRLKSLFGKQAQLVCEILAALSARTPVETNYRFGIDALNKFNAGDYDAQLKKYQEGLDKWDAGKISEYVDATGLDNPKRSTFLNWWIDEFDLKPRQTNGKLFAANSKALLRALHGSWEGGKKTRQFSQNMSGADFGSTIDVWAARTLHRLSNEGIVDRWRILPEHENAVQDDDFDVAQKVYKHAADKVGVKPDALQGTLWFKEKDLWEKRGWTRGAGAEKSDFSSLISETEKHPSGEYRLKTPQLNLLEVKPRPIRK